MQVSNGDERVGFPNSSMKCIRFDVCKGVQFGGLCVAVVSSMKCIRFDVCKDSAMPYAVTFQHSSMKCIRFDVCKLAGATERTRRSSTPQ